MPIEILDKRSPVARRQNDVFGDVYGRPVLCLDCGKAVGPFSSCQACGGRPHYPVDPASIAGFEVFKAHAIGVDGNGCAKCMASYLDGVLSMQVLVPALENLLQSLPDEPLVGRALGAAKRLLGKGY